MDLLNANSFKKNFWKLDRVVSTWCEILCGNIPLYYLKADFIPYRQNFYISEWTIEWFPFWLTKGSSYTSEEIPSLQNEG